MKAIIWNGACAELAELPTPIVASGDDVVVQVAAVGICRTDLYAASGNIAVPKGRILGHEVVGTVIEVGDRVRHVFPGQRVVLSPILPCHFCNPCARKQKVQCSQRKFLGVDFDGGFSEFVKVSVDAVFPISSDLSAEEAMYIEPVAATLSVLDSGLTSDDRGAVFGEGRHARLTKRILELGGISNVALVHPDERIMSETYDFIVETLPTAENIRRAIQALIPRGRLILKSRPCRAVQIPFLEIVTKEITVRGANYGSFSQAVELLESRMLEVKNLVGQPFALEDFVEAFESAKRSETTKPYFKLRSEW
jgi:threonine dehydrogenase-like Zn-dependent dehydrogenase